MKIFNSSVQLFSQHTAIVQHEVKESLQLWIGHRRPAVEGQGSPLSERWSGATLHFSQAARGAQPSKQIAPADAEMDLENEPKLTLIIRMVEIITGKKIKLISPRELRSRLDAAREQAQQTTEALSNLQRQGDPATAVPQSAGFGIEYDAYERHYEAEKMTFSAAGIIKTHDGREIEFSVDVSMSREFLREQSVSIRAGDAVLKDPLVFNFSGDAAELTTTRFSFDIDSDGRQDQIAFVGPDSGFLALDRDNDGVINEGRELFGPTTGQGFAELAVYDQDDNQWIDENDPIYANLRIWSKNAQGQDQLVALGQRGVGAIYLGQVTSPFSFKDSESTLLGQIRSSGVFLRENGTAGTIQHIDLVV